MPVKSNVEWKFWGKHDPLWGVAALQGRNKDGQNPWSDEEFYELGRMDWSDFIIHWEKYGLESNVAVEIGCGAGRITKPMAAYFHQVYAFDVSEDMITYASKNISDENVEFKLSNGSEIPVATKSVNSVFSTHVFQHLDSLDDAALYFREIARVLVPGGTMMIHLPVYSWPYGMGKWVERVYQLIKVAGNLRAELKRYILKKGGSAHLMRMRSYSIDNLYTLLPKFGFEHIEICIFTTTSNNAPHPFVFARKAGR